MQSWHQLPAEDLRHTSPAQPSGKSPRHRDSRLRETCGHSIDAVTSHEAAPPSRNQERVVDEFRARGGKVGGYHASMQLLLLTTTGARTGQRRAVPLTYLPDGDRYIVTAGNAGADRHPAWYYNVAANPDVTIEVETEVFEAVAIIADEAERGALYELFAATYPQLDGYQARTIRQIPLVILRRR